MTGRYKPYPVYKDSHGEWMGPIPRDWTLMQAKFCFVLQRGHDLSSDQMIEGEFPVYGSNGSIGTHNSFTTKAPSITVGRSGSVGEINYVEVNFWAHNTSLYVKDFNHSSPRFIYYLLLAINPKRLSAGSAVGTLDRNNIHSQKIAVPSDFEKNNIANFLDYQTAKIDILIKKQQQLIQLLKEKRQTVISHAVTKGLNPNVKMRESGVEWLGEVPEHWTVAKLSFRYEVSLGKMLDNKRVTGDHLGRYLRNTDVQWDIINEENLPEMDFRPEEKERYSVIKGDLVVCEGGEIGRSAIWAKEYSCFYQKALHRLRPLIATKDNTRFMFFVLFNAVYQERFISGAGNATIAHLPAETFRQFKFAYPPYDEQLEIAKYLDKQKYKFDTLERKTEQQIFLLQERRAALISAAVTGKIDVRDWVAPEAEQTNKEVAA